MSDHYTYAPKYCLGGIILEHRKKLILSAFLACQSSIVMANQDTPNSAPPVESKPNATETGVIESLLLTFISRDRDDTDGSQFGSQCRFNCGPDVRSPGKE